MANTTLTHDLVFKDALSEFRNNTIFANMITPHYDDSYSAHGAKAGSDIRLMTPVEYEVRSGNNMDIKDSEEKAVTMTRSVLRGIDLKFSSSEMEQDVELFNRTKVAPAMATLASYVDNYCLDLAYKDIYQAAAIPSGNVDRVDILNAGIKLDIGTAQRGAGQRCTLLGPQAMGDLVNDASGLFNNATSISQQYDDGIIKVDAMGFQFGMSNNIASHTTGTHTTGSTTPVTNGAATAESKALVTDGWANSTLIFKQGDIFQVTGINSTNPLLKTDDGVPQNFVVTADATSDGSGNLTIAHEPAMIASGPYQNITSLPAGEIAIVPYATEGTTYKQGLSFHKGFGAISFVDLPKPMGGGAYIERKVDDGISMRLWIDSDIKTNTEYMRFDVLFGYKTVVPRWGARTFEV